MKYAMVKLVQGRPRYWGFPSVQRAKAFVYRMIAARHIYGFGIYLSKGNGYKLIREEVT